MANDWTLTIDIGAGQVATTYATWSALDTALAAYRTGAGSTLLYAKIKQNGSPTLPISLNRLFNTCENLQTIIFEDIDTSAVGNLGWLCESCVSLTSIDFGSRWDTSNVGSADYMFASCGITTLDLSGWDTSKVYTFLRAFRNCPNLVTIYAGDLWSVASVTNGAQMFQGCTKLVGAISYNASKIDHTYANWTTGYLTYKSAPQPPTSKAKPLYRVSRMNSPYQVGRIN